MKIKVELFGASREFSKNNLIEFEIKNNSTIKNIRDEMINYLDLKFDGNKDFKIKYHPKPYGVQILLKLILLKLDLWF